MNVQSIMKIPTGFQSYNAGFVNHRIVEAVCPKMQGAVTPAFAGLSAFAAAYPILTTTVVVIITAVTFAGALSNVVEMVKTLANIIHAKYWPEKESERPETTSSKWQVWPEATETKKVEKT